MIASQKKAEKSRKKKKPKKITPKYLENVSLYYLERFAASSDSLRQVLKRRVYKSARYHDIEDETRGEWLAQVEELIKRFERAGLLDDHKYAREKAASFLKRGHSLRLIALKLKSKGIADDIIQETLKGLKNENVDPDLAAARKYTHKRKLGPYRLEKERADYYEKDLAALARRGFSYDIAREVLNETVADDEDEPLRFS